MRCRNCSHDPCRHPKLCDMFLSHKPPGLSGNTPTGWPMKSEAMACHPSQVPEMLERNKRHGVVGVTYDRHGRAILADQAAKRALCKLEGMYDKNGGYGDTYESSTPLKRTDEVPFSDAGVDVTFNTEATK